MTISQDMGPEIYETEFEPPDLNLIVDDDLNLDFGDVARQPRPKMKPKDPLDEIGVERDRWGRPMILPDPDWNLAPGQWPDGKVEKRQMADGRRHMVRVSTVAGWNDLAHGLSIWKLRHGLLALARRPDLQAMLCALTYKDGKVIDGIMDQLLIRASDDGSDPGGELTAANRGTAWHGFTVPGAPVIDPTFGPTLADYEVSRRAFCDKLEECGLELVEHEKFCVDYSRRTAGTVDHLIRVGTRTAFSEENGFEVGDHLLGDKKTGKMQWITHMTQLTAYSRCRPHDHRTGRTRDWHPNFRQDKAIIVAGSIETGKVKLYCVDTPDSLVDSAISRYRQATADSVNAMVSRGY